MNLILNNLPYLWSGLKLTLILSAIGLVGSFAVGLILALMRMSAWWCLRWPAIIYVDFVRMIPFIMVIFWIFFLIPILTGHSVTPLISMIIALISFSASYMAEIIRAGIQSVPDGLIEAARGSGMNNRQAMQHIVLPIALRNILPALISRFVSLIIATSLAYVIGVTELFRAANDINNRELSPYTIFTFVAVVYFILCYGLSLLGRLLEIRLSRGGTPLSGDRFTSG